MSKRKQELYSLRKNIKETLALYWKIDKFSFIQYILLAFIQVASSLLAVFFASRIIGELTVVIKGNSLQSNEIYWWLTASVLAIGLERLAWRWINFVEKRSWIKWYVYIMVRFNDAVSNLDMQQHHNPEFEKMLTKLQLQYTYTPQNFANSILYLFHSFARLFSTLIVVLTFAPLLVLVLALSLIPGFFTEKRLSKLKWNLWGEKGDKSRLADRITYYLQNKNKLQETKILNTRKFLLDKLAELHESFYERQLKQMQAIKSRALGSLIIEALALGGVNLWLILNVLYHGMTLASFTFYSGILAQFGSTLGMIVGNLNMLYDENEFMKDLYRLFDTKPVLPTSQSPVKFTKNEELTIEFRNVYFKYPNAKHYSLRGVSFIIEPNEKIAIVGENGAGKTTIIKLLLRFYDVTSGEILINGVNIKQLEILSYYEHIGVLFQNFNDYPFSVRDNIALGDVSKFIDEKSIITASMQADADKFIQNYPNKYDQILEVGFKDGIEPSGGHWQRIALARALFRNSNILILDEPTAAVDANSEYQIFKTLDKYSKDKTTVIISHRFSTVRTAEKIYVIKEGTIVESGSHKQLVANNNGIYKEMFEKQAKGYK